MVNRSATWADWDEELLALELQDLKALDFDLSLTGFDTKELDDLILDDTPAEDGAPPLPAVPVSSVGDLCFAVRTGYSAATRLTRRWCRGCWATTSRF